MSNAQRPLKLNNNQNRYVNNLENHVEEQPNLTLAALKALRIEKSYNVDVIFYTRNNPNTFDANDQFTKNIKPAFTDELGQIYWMAFIIEGVRQYTIDIPIDFDISARINNNKFNYRIVENHGEIHERRNIQSLMECGIRNMFKR
jgi:hypothetical protein